MPCTNIYDSGLKKVPSPAILRLKTKDADRQKLDDPLPPLFGSHQQRIDPTAARRRSRRRINLDNLSLGRFWLGTFAFWSDKREAKPLDLVIWHEAHLRNEDCRTKPAIGGRTFVGAPRSRGIGWNRECLRICSARFCGQQSVERLQLISLIRNSCDRA